MLRVLSKKELRKSRESAVTVMREQLEDLSLKEED